MVWSIAEENTVAPTFMIGGYSPCWGMWDGFILDVLKQTDANTAYGMAQRGYTFPIKPMAIIFRLW